MPEPAAIDLAVLDEAARPRSLGDRMADSVALRFGSWMFILAQSVLFFGWVIWNLVAPGQAARFDPAPFIGLNLILSLEAAYTGAVLQIAANRQSGADRAVLRALVTQQNAILAELHQVTDEVRSMVAEVHALTVRGNNTETP